MFERFTEGTRKVMSIAREIAQKYNNNYIGIEHVLGALAEYVDVEDETLKNELSSLASKFSIVGRSEQTSITQLPFTDGARKMLENSLDSANILKSDSIDVCHIALAILGDKMAAPIFEGHDFYSRYINHFFEVGIGLSIFPFITAQPKENVNERAKEKLDKSIIERAMSDLSMLFWNLMTGMQREALYVDDEEAGLHHLFLALAHGFFDTNSTSIKLRELALKQITEDKEIDLETRLAVRLTEEVRAIMKAVEEKVTGKPITVYKKLDIVNNFKFVVLYAITEVCPVFQEKIVESLDPEDFDWWVWWQNVN